MSLFDAFQSARSTATRLYKRGMDKAKARNMRGAVVDYTAVIDMPQAPPDVIAMAQLNRALAYSAVEEYASAIGDLHAVIDSADAPVNVKAAAKEKLKRMQWRQGGKSDQRR